MEASNLNEIEELENDWIFSKVSKKIKIKISGEDDLFIKTKDIHIFFNRLVKIKKFGILIFYFGKSLFFLNEKIIVNLLEQVKLI